MRSYIKKFIPYENERDVVFVFGAGASAGEGAPLQGDLLKLIFNSSNEFICFSEDVKELKTFISNNFHISQNEYPSLESVFGYMDYFINKKEGLGNQFSTIKLIKIKEILIQLIHHTISTSLRTGNSTYHKFWKKISDINRNISIVTMNYDTLLDEAFDFLYSERGYIDYCLELMNYHDFNMGSDWWDNPRLPLTVWDGADPKPIKLIKIHGSLNWKYCNCCNQVLLTPWDTAIDLRSMRFTKHIYEHLEPPIKIELELTCPYDRNPFETFIVPPSHIKNLTHPAINKLIDEASIEIRKTKKIIFVGYSFPEADVHIKAMLKKNLSPAATVYVVNPGLNSGMETNYTCLSKNIFFFKKSFDNFINENIEKIINPKERK